MYKSKIHFYYYYFRELFFLVKKRVLFALHKEKSLWNAFFILIIKGDDTDAHNSIF